MEGTLYYDWKGERIGLRDDDGKCLRDGIHIGEKLEILLDGKWKDDELRWNKLKGWYLRSQQESRPVGMRARVF